MFLFCTSLLHIANSRVPVKDKTLKNIKLYWLVGHISTWETMFFPKPSLPASQKDEQTLCIEMSRAHVLLTTPLLDHTAFETGVHAVVFSGLEMAKGITACYVLPESENVEELRLLEKQCLHLLVSLGIHSIKHHKKIKYRGKISNKLKKRWWVLLWSSQQG